MSVWQIEILSGVHIGACVFVENSPLTIGGSDTASIVLSDIGLEEETVELSPLTDERSIRINSLKSTPSGRSERTDSDASRIIDNGSVFLIGDTKVLARFLSIDEYRQLKAKGDVHPSLGQSFVSTPMRNGPRAETAEGQLEDDDGKSKNPTLSSRLRGNLIGRELGPRQRTALLVASFAGILVSLIFLSYGLNGVQNDAIGSLQVQTVGHELPQRTKPGPVRIDKAFAGRAHEFVRSLIAEQKLQGLGTRIDFASGRIEVWGVLSRDQNPSWEAIVERFEERYGTSLVLDRDFVGVKGDGAITDQITGLSIKPSRHVIYDNNTIVPVGGTMPNGWSVSEITMSHLTLKNDKRTLRINLTRIGEGW